MEERHIDSDGARSLVEAIVNQAKLDVLNYEPDTVVRRDAEKFFNSKWFESLTGLNGKPILRELRIESAKKRRKCKNVRGYEFSRVSASSCEDD